jgi:hypothetical protein
MRAAGVFVAVGIGITALGLAWVGLRPNRAEVHPALAPVLETWDVVSDGVHNSNTDLILCREQFFLVHAASPYHLGTSRARLVVRRSRDGRHFERTAELRVPGRDIRDPKLAAIGGRLLLYALTNADFFATPSRTVLATSEDGERWTAFEPVEPAGWLLWRPKTLDGETWYVAAYWHEHGRSILLRSADGRRWSEVATIHEGEGNDETAIEFLPDGRLLATARLEITPDALTGNAQASTLLAVAEPPYERWSRIRSRVTRLDGPVLFSAAGRVFAVARHHPGKRGPLTWLGSALSRKRTALYEVRPDRLGHLSDLPSAGDTSYAGAVQREGLLHVSYYTSSVRRDAPWILGMFLPSDVRMARLPVAALLALAEEAGGP